MPRIFKMQPNQPEILLTIFKGMPPRVDVLVEGAVKFSYICALLDFFNLHSTCFQGINILRLNISCKSRLMMRIGGQDFFHPIVDAQ